MYVVLNPLDMQAIASELKKESTDYYLFFMLMYKTGLTGAKLLRLTTKDCKGFIAKNEDLIGLPLIKELQEHIQFKTPSSPVFCSAFSDSPLPRRTVDLHIQVTAKRVLDMDNFGFRNICRTFYYEYLRNNDFEYEKLRKLLSKRKFYKPTLDDFLKYCELPYDEYKKDVDKYRAAQLDSYVTNAQESVRILMQIISDKDITPQKEQDYNLRIRNVLDILKPLSDTDNP